MHLPTPQDLRERRTELELTQSELADRAGVSQPLIARIEGSDVDPRLSTLRRIVEALDEAEGDVVRARTLMHESVVSVSPDDKVRVAVERMQEEGYSQLPVITNGVPVGSISESDVVSAGEDVGSKTVRDVMSESFPTVSEDASLEEISSLLDHYKAVMVTEEGETVGIITQADVAARLS
ncbi:CBS domain-containing protein [Halanaeroarchaeum sulfurireducens]|uniref:XRE family transcriptional regulator n=1 Tax=Halanaeroarchaeum sulfurireducens TaxID=1604004 RepID=A0A0F7PEE5_9EURY|nr:CBS domain-containing protein [Halanaeroarchaeum sulfurireducens]AKH97989.1 XRE family transcriptional regulator [Halanaeroarchaeum sulfurireducens]ALG82383.1 XRE family transcriptional regulator [Halanaeroarchaeum sulfurireducens]